MSCFHCVQCASPERFPKCRLHGHFIPAGIDEPICRDFESHDTGDTLVSPGFEVFNRHVPVGGLSYHSDYYSTSAFFLIAPFSELDRPRLSAILSPTLFLLRNVDDDPGARRVVISADLALCKGEPFPIATEILLSCDQRQTRANVAQADEYGKTEMTVENARVLADCVAAWLAAFELEAPPTGHRQQLLRQFGISAMLEICSETELRLWPNELMMRMMLSPAHG